MKNHLGRWLSAVVVSLVGCSSGSHGSFDAQNAPFGTRTPTTVSHSTVQLGSSSINGVTQVVGSKTIGGTTYSRLSYTNASDPSSGVEWWINEKPGESITLAGWDGHSQLAQSLLIPPGVVVLDQPLTVQLNPPLNTPQPAQPATVGANITVAGDSTPHQGQVTGQYTLIEDNATVDTSMGTIHGCKHVSGSSTVTSDLLPSVVTALPLSGELWYHPDYGVVAFNSPELGLGLKMTDTSDCGAPDSDGFAIVRKVGIVDSAHPFKVSTFDDCSQQFDADKNEHAKMLLELRWADDTKAKAGAVDTLGPMLHVEFGDITEDLDGYFDFAPTKSPVSIFHPEENGQGFNYYYGYVSQADRYKTTNGIEYHVSVGLDSGASPIRATARIYYKKFPVGGVPGNGGATGTGGITGAGGMTGAGGITGAGGVTAVGGKTGAGGITGVGGVTAAAGITGAGGITGTGGIAAAGTGGTSSGTETFLLKMESVLGVSYNPPVPTTFTLSQSAYITRVWTYHYAATIGSKTPTVAFQNTTTGTIYGPWSQIGYTSFNSNLNTSKSDPGNVLGPPDNYWAAYPAQTVPAGTYQVIDSDPTTWAYTSDMGNKGCAWVYGWLVGAAADAGAADGPVAIKDAGGVEAAGADGAALPSTSNLIVNGDAEQGVGSADGSPVTTPGWTVTGEATALQYGVSGYPATTDPGPTNRGLNLFVGGASDALSTLAQTISLASYATRIDAGQVTFALQGYLGGFESQDDNAALTVSFRNASGTELATATIGPVTSADRSATTGLLFRSTSGSLPVGVRSAVVTLTLTRLEGTANDGYADNLSLVLTGI